MKIKKRILSLALAGALTLGLLPAFSSPALAADGDTTYTLTIPSTLNVANSGWNATDGISATGTLASGKKLTVTASSDGEFALVNQSDNTQKVGYKLATASTDTEATTSWEFTELSSTATKKDMGIIVEDYSSKPAGTYRDTVTFTASVADNTPAVSISDIKSNGAVLKLNYTGDAGNTQVIITNNNGTLSCTSYDSISYGRNFNTGSVSVSLSGDTLTVDIPLNTSSAGGTFSFNLTGNTYTATKTVTAVTVNGIDITNQLTCSE